MSLFIAFPEADFDRVNVLVLEGWSLFMQSSKANCSPTWGAISVPVHEQEQTVCPSSLRSLHPAVFS
jgi:hypothetical protein